jgi:prepilin-type N-terminal cleavage/methylation domain-containing protein
LQIGVQSRFYHERGFTLVEVLVALAILAVAIMSVFAIYTQCTVEIRRAKNRTLATNCVQQMMEMICSTPHAFSNYDGLTTASDPPASNPVKADLLSWQSALQTFPTQAIGTISVGDEPYASLVTVEVKYDNYGRTTTTTLVLKIAKPSS